MLVSQRRTGVSRVQPRTNPPLMTEPQMNVMTLRQRGVLHLEDFISRDVALDVAEWESDKP